MSWLEDAVRDFGRGMNLDDLAFNDAGVILLEIEQLGTLFVERHEDHLLIGLSQTRPIHQMASLAADILRLCHFDRGHHQPTHGGIRGENQVVFWQQISQEDCDVPTLERAMTDMLKCHQELGVNP